MEENITLEMIRKIDFEYLEREYGIKKYYPKSFHNDTVTTPILRELLVDKPIYKDANKHMKRKKVEKGGGGGNGTKNHQTTTTDNCEPNYIGDSINHDNGDGNNGHGPGPVKNGWTDPLKDIDEGGNNKNGRERRHESRQEKRQERKHHRETRRELKREYRHDKKVLRQNYRDNFQNNTTIVTTEVVPGNISTNLTHYNGYEIHTDEVLSDEFTFDDDDDDPDTGPSSFPPDYDEVVVTKHSRLKQKQAQRLEGKLLKQNYKKHNRLNMKMAHLGLSDDGEDDLVPENSSKSDATVTATTGSGSGIDFNNPFNNQPINKNLHLKLSPKRRNNSITSKFFNFIKNHDDNNSSYNSPSYKVNQDFQDLSHPPGEPRSRSRSNSYDQTKSTLTTKRKWKMFKKFERRGSDKIGMYNR